MSIKITVKGDWKKTDKFLERVKNLFKLGVFDKYGRAGVNALQAATPVDSGLTANSWSYKIKRSHGKVSIVWSNSNVNKGVPIAVILQYGHGTGTGGYVAGRDYINPAMRSIFDNMADELWREVTK